MLTRVLCNGRRKHCADRFFKLILLEGSHSDSHSIAAKGIGLKDMFAALSGFLYTLMGGIDKNFRIAAVRCRARHFEYRMAASFVRPYSTIAQ